MNLQTLVSWEQDYESSGVDREIARPYFLTYIKGIRHDPDTKTLGRRETEVRMRGTKTVSEQEEM